MTAPISTTKSVGKSMVTPAPMTAHALAIPRSLPQIGAAGARVAPARLREVLTDQVHAYRVMAVGLGDATVYQRMPLGDKALADAALAQERAS